MGDGSLSQEDIDALLLGGDEDADASADGLSLDDVGVPEIPEMDGLDALESLTVPTVPEEPKKKPATKKRSSKSGYEDSANMELLLDVKMNIAVELGRTKMQVDNVLNLGPGSIVELDKLNGELVDILVNNRLIARGEVVAVDETFGVKISEIIDASERFKLELL